MNALAEPWMDDLEAQVSATAARVTMRLGARRRSRRIAVLAAAATLVVGGAALAQTTPFHPLASFQNLVGAQRATTPADALPPALRKQFDRAIVGGVDLDTFRLMATFDGNRIYAAPRKGGSLCLILALGKQGGVTACGPRLGPTIPLTAVLTRTHPGAGSVLAGLARDDVRSILITVGGVPRRISVRNNAFLYEAAPFTTIKYSFVAELRDGSAVTYPAR